MMVGRILSLFAFITASLVQTTVALDRKLSTQLFTRGVVRGQQNLERTAVELLENNHDQITTFLCGTASPLGNGSGAQSCTAVFVNGQFLVFDIGDGALQSMWRSALPTQNVTAVFLTHYHNDHYADLGELMEWSWVNGRQSILPIYGPTGVKSIVDGYNQAYKLDRGYRVAHHGEGILPPQAAAAQSIEFDLQGDDDMVSTGKVIYEKDGVVVRAFGANHEPVDPAVGYRIEYAGAAVVLSGDTLPTGLLLESSRGADLLVSEVMNFEMVQEMEHVFREELGDVRGATLLYDIRDYHIDVHDIGPLAQKAGVVRLALTHLAPVPTSDWFSRQWFYNPVSELYSGALFAGKDGMRIDIPLHKQG